jgi:hypothetical protein
MENAIFRTFNFPLLPSKTNSPLPSTPFEPITITFTLTNVGDSIYHNGSRTRCLQMYASLLDLANSLYHSMARSILMAEEDNQLAETPESKMTALDLLGAFGLKTNARDLQNC